MAEPRFAGVELNLGGTVYTVPPLGMRAVRTLLPKIDAIQFGSDDMPTAESLDDVFLVLHAAFKRNYPEVTLDEFVDLLELHTFPAVVKAVFKSSGFDRAERGTEGNGSSAALPIGTPSTLDSAPPSDGPGSTSTSS